MSIDTLKLRLDAWSIKSGAELVLKRSNMNFQTGEIRDKELFIDSSGRKIKGSGAFINSQNINFDIKPFRDEVYAFVQFSAPKQIRKNNYQALEESELSQALENVEKELSSFGIETDINKAVISRIDINKDIQTEEKIESYARLFSLLQANRAKNKKTYGVTGWLFANERTEYCIYNKLEEMKSHKINTASLPDTLRFEHRALKSDKVKEFYQFTTISELKKYGFKALEKKQAQTWKDNLFKYEIKELEYIAESQLRSELMYYQSIYGKFWLSRYLKDYGACHLTSNAGGIEVIERTLDSMDCSRLKIYRAKRELNEAILRTESLKPEPINIKTLGSLYNELRQKVCEYA
jgi:hypothetical protein